MALLLYNLLLTLFAPLIYLFLLYRLQIGKEDRAHWSERWGRLPDAAEGGVGQPRVWVHAVSVGEVMAAAPVLRALRGRFPDAFLLLTTTTPGGREVALQQCPPADMVAYYPLDFAPIVRRAIGAFRPDAVLLMEWEIWPNFLQAAERRGARIAVLNGRISDKGLRRGQRGGFFTRPGLAAVDRFAMQSDEDARRAVAVGADPSRVVTLGNTKFDESANPLSPTERTALRADLRLPADAPVWVCGSTRPGEEAIIADAVERVWRELPNLRLIVAPRHLDRADEVAKLFEAQGVHVSRRSRQRKNKGDEQHDELVEGAVFLLDTFGELGSVYAVADVAFVGGSLLPFGGQSVFQPLAQGVPAVFGPHMRNQRDIAALAVGAGVGFEVTDAASLAREVLRLVDQSTDEKNEMAGRARTLIERNQGVAARCVDLVANLLDEKGA